MQTTLNLLTRDGALYLAFSPPLSADQHIELLELSKTADDRIELCNLVLDWAKTSGLQLSLNETSDPASIP
jgi:hypothetical protein